MVEFEAILTEDLDGTFVARCPSLPTCRGAGETPDDAIEGLRMAIHDYLAPVMRICPELMSLNVKDRTARTFIPSRVALAG
ncbi:MAG: type II toxin-antitoxin system HicB family antitoxin [Planctomycetaceae bacterium]|nr:type II toxin-antitoxin system HicB family antitoxin [Planctomycetaceae bacterium]